MDENPGANAIVNENVMVFLLIDALSTAAAMSSLQRSLNLIFLSRNGVVQFAEVFGIFHFLAFENFQGREARR